MKMYQFILVFFLAVGVFLLAQLQKESVISFKDCIDIGNPVLDSYPRQCIHKGQTFIEEIGNELEQQEHIFLSTPRPNDIITSPLIITGEARGSWFFEGDFPIQLTNWDGLIIAEGYAKAEGDWMTESFIPFSAQLEFEQPTLYPRGSLILQKDNPSGLPEHDDALEIPVWFWEE